MGRPSSGKVTMTTRIDPDILDHLRGWGQGWQPKLNDKLREWLKL